MEKKSNITDEMIDKLAGLAKLEYDQKSKEEIKKDLHRILGFISKLDELDTSKTEPLIFMTNEKNVLRKDESKNTITQDEALKNAPDKDSDYFKVKKVLKK